MSDKQQHNQNCIQCIMILEKEKQAETRLVELALRSS